MDFTSAKQLVANGELDFSSPKNRAVFYSGYETAVREHSGTLAVILSTGLDFTTIEKTIGGKKLIELIKDAKVSESEVDSIWRLASAEFAKKASGNVIAYVTGAESEKAFLQVELPHLLTNQKVTSINNVSREKLFDVYISKRNEGREVAAKAVKDEILFNDLKVQSVVQTGTQLLNQYEAGLRNFLLDFQSSVLSKAEKAQQKIRLERDQVENQMQIHQENFGDTEESSFNKIYDRESKKRLGLLLNEVTKSKGNLLAAQKKYKDFIEYEKSLGLKAFSPILAIKLDKKAKELEEQTRKADEIHSRSVSDYKQGIFFTHTEHFRSIVKYQVNEARKEREKLDSDLLALDYRLEAAGDILRDAYQTRHSIARVLNRDPKNAHVKEEKASVQQIPSKEIKINSVRYQQL